MNHNNNIIKFTFKDVSERDMDILFLEEFSMSVDFCKIFIKEPLTSDFEIVSLEHSKMDNDLGESDIVVIYKDSFGHHGILVEDKIDAGAQPNQFERYVLRGEKGIKQGEFDDYIVFIIAPENYLQTNESARDNYPNKVSYEEIICYFRKIGDARSTFKIQQIEQAILKEKHGYTVIEDEKVTLFWNSYFEYQKTAFDYLDCKSKAKAKGSKATWAEYRTAIAKYAIVYKSERGCVDLQIPISKICANKAMDEIVESIKNTECSECEIQIIPHSRKKDIVNIVIRCHVPIVNVKQSFDKQKAKVDESFAAVKRLKKLESEIRLYKYSFK